jgi:hypothetical protein
MFPQRRSQISTLLMTSRACSRASTTEITMYTSWFCAADTPVAGVLLDLHARNPQRHRCLQLRQGDQELVHLFSHRVPNCSMMRGFGVGLRRTVRRLGWVARGRG